MILGARKRTGDSSWSQPFLMADTPEFPDTNCCMIIDPNNRLWLLWPTIQANLWESALMKYQISENYHGDGPPVWNQEKVLHIKPGDSFPDEVREKTAAYLSHQQLTPDMIQWAHDNFQQADDKLTRRLGWLPRAHPKILDQQRMLVGLYSGWFFLFHGGHHRRLGDSLDLQRTHYWRREHPTQLCPEVERSFGHLHEG